MLLRDFCQKATKDRTGDRPVKYEYIDEELRYEKNMWEQRSIERVVCNQNNMDLQKKKIQSVVVDIVAVEIVFIVCMKSSLL